MTANGKEYPREEMELRWGRATELMEKNGLDALFITERGNFWWLNGARSSTPFYNKMRPNVAIMPKGRSPSLLVYSLERARTAESTWAEDVRSFVDAPFPPRSAIDLLEELGLERSRIGMEFGASQRMWFSIGQLEE